MQHGPTPLAEAEALGGTFPFITASTDCGYEQIAHGRPGAQANQDRGSETSNRAPPPGRFEAAIVPP